MTVLEGIREIERIDRGIGTLTVVVVRRTISFGVEQARKRSSGPWSLQQLADMDHPFAVRHGSPLLDPSIINRQTGRFIAAWQGESGATGGRVINNSEVADFLDQGTTFMFRRPIGDALEAEMTTFAEHELIAGLTRVIN